MIFVDTGAWIALADRSDQYHAVAEKQHRQFLKKRRKYVTSDFVVGEVIDYLLLFAKPVRGILQKVIAPGAQTIPPGRCQAGERSAWPWELTGRVVSGMRDEG